MGATMAPVKSLIDIRGRKMISEKPVEVKGLEWTLSGNRVEITEGGGAHSVRSRRDYDADAGPQCRPR